MAEHYYYRPTYYGKRTISAEIVAREFQRLSATGDLTSERIVEEASPEDAPLHPTFEWDDSAAAHQYRLQQARHLARAILVVEVSEEIVEKEPAPHSLLVHVPAPENNEAGRYVYLVDLPAQPGDFDLALTELQHKLDAARQSVREVQRFGAAPESTAAVVHALDEASSHLNALRKNREKA